MKVEMVFVVDEGEVGGGGGIMSVVNVATFQS